MGFNHTALLATHTFNSQQSWTWVGSVYWLGWVGKLQLFRGLGWDSTGETFWCKRVAWTVAVLLSWIIVSLNGIWIVCDVLMYQHIHVIRSAYYHIVFIAECRWWVGLGHGIISVISVGWVGSKKFRLGWVSEKGPTSNSPQKCPFPEEDPDPQGSFGHTSLLSPNGISIVHPFSHSSQTHQTHLWQ